MSTLRNCVAIDRTKPIYQRTDYQLVCSDYTGPYSTIVSTSYSKQQHETYLQLDCGLVACIYSCHTPISFHSSRLPGPIPGTGPLVASAKQNAPVPTMYQRSQQRGDETILRGRLPGGSSQQVHLKRHSPMGNSANVGQAAVIAI